ncbi:MAG: DUF6541 family protein [Thermoanaerobaculia bacterium]
MAEGGDLLIEIAGLAATLAALFLPGLALVRREEWERAEPIELAAVAAASSLAFWAVAFWIVRLVPMPFRAFAAAVLLAALAALVLQRGALRLTAVTWLREPAAALWGALFVGGVLALRLAFAAPRLGFSGGDMTAHAALAEMIVLKDGFPETQEPLAPVGHFGRIAPGFHAVSALVTLLSNVPTYRSTILVFCAAAAALTFSLYALLRSWRLARWPAAAGAFGALFVARNPQFFLQWGGAPMLAALAVAFLLLRDLLRLPERCDAAYLARTALLAAGTLLIHPLPAVSLLYVFAAAAAVRILTGRASVARLAANCAAAGALALLIALPFLLSSTLSVPARLALWAHGWFREETLRAVLLERRFLPGPRRDAALATWPFYLVVYLGVLPTALLFAGLAKRWWKDRGEATLAATAILGVCLLLFAGGLGEFLPLWPALFPTRTSAWLAVPLAAALAGLAAPLSRLPRAAMVFVALDLAAAFAWEGWQLRRLEFGTAFYEAAKAGRSQPLSVAAHEMAGGAFWVATRSLDNSALAGDDLAAFAWIRERTPADAVFANNLGDGGGLLPAAAHRKIFAPHFYWFFDEPEMAAWRAKTRIDYVYVGARPSPAWPRRFQTETLEKDPGVEEVFRSGAARVFRIKDPFDSRFR